MNFQEISIGDKAAWYNVRRNELLGLLERVQKLDLTDYCRNQLAPIRKKCLENQFEIVLSGEFQGGKSTTFNTLCDGRDLSPRGLNGGGIKTSAAIISAQNISDDEKRDGMTEWAEITYKTKAELAQEMFDLLGSDLSGNDEVKKYLASSGKNADEAFENAANFGLAIDLEAQPCKKAINELLGDLWKLIKEDPGALDDVKSDQLRIATLIMRYLGTEDYRKLISKTIYGVEDYQKLVKFPSSWIQRWVEGGMKASFSFDEAAFVFVGRVLMRIHSSALQHIGCRITDCPGLFANDYDTRVAKTAILNADSTWYLIGGDKQIGQQDLKSLDEIKSLVNDPARIILSANIREDQEQKIQEILPETKSILKTHGLNGDLHPYNARMAFLAEQGRRLLDHQDLTSYELACMKSDAGKDGRPEDLWAKMIHKVGNRIDVEDIADIDELTPKSLQLVRKKSCIDAILASIHQIIINSKARSILLTNGSTELVRALLAYEGKLQSVEDAAQKTEEGFRADCDAKRQKLENFVNGVAKIQKKQRDSGLYDFWANDMGRELLLLAFDEKMAREIAMALATSAYELKNKFYPGYREKYQSDVKNRAAPEIDRIIKDAINRALGDIHMQSPTWKKNLNNVHGLLDKITDCWANEIGDDQDFKGLKPNLPHCEKFDSFVRDMRNDLLNKDTTEKAIADMNPGKFKCIWYAICDSCSWAKRKIKSLFAPTSDRHPDTAAEGPATEKEKERIGKIANDNFENVSKSLKDYAHDPENQKRMAPPFVGMWDKFDALISEASKVVLTRYEEEQVKPALEQFRKAQSEREAIAAENRRIRTEQIEPIRKEVQEFESLVTRELQLS